MPLTDIACKNAKAKEKPYKLFDGGGLYIEVSTIGSRLWRLKYRINGKEKRLALGSYPLVSLQDARSEREKAKKLLSEGIDPSIAKMKEKQARTISQENTFLLIANEWHKNQFDKWSKRHADNILHRLNTDIFPYIGSYPVSEITPPELLAVLKKIENRGASEVAHRTKQICSQVFRYAIITGRAERDPAADLKGALKPVITNHYNALDSKDLPAFLSAIERNEARLFPNTRRAVLLLLLTFVRTSELINAKWSEFDFDNKQWVIPAERMKMRRAHIVPLSSQALALLQEQHSYTGDNDYVFPNAVSPKRPMSNNTILGAIKRLGFKEKTTGHGFRALAMSTIKEKLGYRHEVVDRQLAHMPGNKVDRAYDRAEFLGERTRMMQDWAEFLGNASMILLSK